MVPRLSSIDHSPSAAGMYIKCCIHVHRMLRDVPRFRRVVVTYLVIYAQAIHTDILHSTGR